MRHCGRSLAVALACLATSVLLGGPVTADDVTMGGSFTMNLVEGTPGEDLLPIVGNENGWTAALRDVESRCTEEICPSNPAETIMITTLHAGSFEFAFSGPDTALLNTVVADQLTQGGHAVDGYFEVAATDCSGPLSLAFWFSIWPDVPCEGVYWLVQGFGTLDTFPLDGSDCPIITTFDLDADWAVLVDNRGENDGYIAADHAGRLWLESNTDVSPATWSVVKGLYR